MNRKPYHILLIQSFFANKYQFITVFRVIKWIFLIVLVGLWVAEFLGGIIDGHLAGRGGGSIWF